VISVIDIQNGEQALLCLWYVYLQSFWFPFFC